MGLVHAHQEPMQQLGDECLVVEGRRVKQRAQLRVLRGASHRGGAAENLHAIQGPPRTYGHVRVCPAPQSLEEPANGHRAHRGCLVRHATAARLERLPEQRRRREAL